MQVQLQEPKAGTCVSCATVNALRCHDMDAPVDEVIEALRVKRFHGREGSFVVKAAKYLRRIHHMDVVISRPPYLIRDPIAAALEVAYRFEALLMDGYVGLLRRKETGKEGHAVVLYRIIRDRGEPYFLCYDSNKRHAGGKWTYQVQDYILWRPDEAVEEDIEPSPTGRVGYFVRPGPVRSPAWPQKRSPFRSRRPQFNTVIRADCPSGE